MNERETCALHERAFDAMIETNEKQNKAIERIEGIVLRINDALVGTLTEQGFIGRVDSEIKALQRDVDDLKAWRDGVQEMVKSLVLKVLGGVAALVIAASLATVGVVKFLVG